MQHFEKYSKKGSSEGMRQTFQILISNHVLTAHLADGIYVFFLLFGMAVPVLYVNVGARKRANGLSIWLAVHATKNAA